MQSQHKVVESLHKWNVVLCALHGLSAIAVGYIFSYNTNARIIDSYRGSIPSDLIHPTIDCNGTGAVSCPQKYSVTPIDRCKSIDFPLVCKKMASFDPSTLLISFFLITCLAHFFYALNIGNFYTNAVLKQGWNPYRWVEYSISAAIMIFLISLIDGERNLNAATLLAVMTAVTQYQGFIVENNFLFKNLDSLSPDHSKIIWRNVHTATFSGWLLFAGVWVILFKNFFGVLSDANNIILQPSDPKVKIPIWVYGVVLTQALNFAFFGFVQQRQIKNFTMKDKTQIKPYYHFEKQYMTLSFSAKFILGAFVTYGIIQRAKGAGCSS